MPRKNRLSRTFQQHPEITHAEMKIQSLPLTETVDSLFSERFPACHPERSRGIAHRLRCAGTILRTTERGGFAEVVPCALKRGRDPSTSVGMTEGTRLLRTSSMTL